MAPEAYFQLKIRRQGGRGWPVIAAATRLWVARVPLARAWGSTLSGEPLGWRPKRRAVALQRVRNTVFMQQGQGHTSKVRLPPSPCAHLSHAAVSLCLWFAAPTPLAVAPLPRSLLCPPGDAAPSPRSLLCPPGEAGASVRSDVKTTKPEALKAAKVVLKDLRKAAKMHLAAKHKLLGAAKRAVGTAITAEKKVCLHLASLSYLPFLSFLKAAY